MCRVKISLCGYSGLDVPGIMRHYIKEHSMLYEGESVQCLEKEGRERFITFAAFIINGTGTYHIEPQTRDHRRMDLVVLFRGQRYIIELKIWHSDRYDEEAERQISEYLDRYDLTTGYLLSFNLSQKKTPGVERVKAGGKTLFEGIV